MAARCGLWSHQYLLLLSTRNEIRDPIFHPNASILSQKHRYYGPARKRLVDGEEGTGATDSPDAVKLINVLISQHSLVAIEWRLD